MTELTKILILGGSGQVGTELQRQSWPDCIRLCAPEHRELDLTDEKSISKTIASQPWACVINAAAFTAVDLAEAQVATAWKLNALAPALLASASANVGIPILHVSTDYVFDGRSKEPYQPHDAIGPLSVYGASKEGGEQAVRTSNPKHVIVRTAWVVSPYRSNFVKTMLRLATERDILRVVDDQFGCPTSAADLASTLRTIALRQIDGDAPTGTYHFTNAGKTTWCHFARDIMERARLRGRRSVPVEAITTAEYKTSAQRPAYSVLSTETLTRDYGIEPRTWQEALEEILDYLILPSAAVSEGSR